MGWLCNGQQAQADLNHVDVSVNETNRLGEYDIRLHNMRNAFRTFSLYEISLQTNNPLYNSVRFITWLNQNGDKSL